MASTLTTPASTPPAWTHHRHAGTVLCFYVTQVALRTKGIQFSQYPVENEAGLKNTLHQLLADSTVSGIRHKNCCWKQQQQAGRQRVDACEHSSSCAATLQAAAVAVRCSVERSPCLDSACISTCPKASSWTCCHLSRCPCCSVLQDLRTVVLLNCGASTHVASLAPASCQYTRYIIIDSHRPIHPRYNDPADHECLLVLSDDDPLPAQDIPLANEDLDNMPAEGEQSQDEVSRLWTKAKCL